MLVYGCCFQKKTKIVFIAINPPLYHTGRTKNRNLWTIMRMSTFQEQVCGFHICVITEVAGVNL